MKTCLVVLACCLTLAATLAYAQGAEEGFQMAKVVSFEKLASNAQHPEDADRYKIAMRMNDTIYICRANGPITDFMGFSPGKEFPTKLDAEGKVLLVKAPSGQTVQLNIQSKKMPK